MPIETHVLMDTQLLTESNNLSLSVLLCIGHFYFINRDLIQSAGKFSFWRVVIGFISVLDIFGKGLSPLCYKSTKEKFVYFEIFLFVSNFAPFFSKCTKLLQNLTDFSCIVQT